MMALAAWFGGVFGASEGIGRVDRGISHRPLSVLLPSIIIWLFFSIFTLKREKIAMQSSSHSWPNDINEPVFMLSKTTTSCAVGDS